jgi:hypothetical protein
MNQLFFILLIAVAPGLSVMGQSEASSANGPVMLEIRCRPALEAQPRYEIELADRRTGQLAGTEVWTWLILTNGNQTVRVFWESRASRKPVVLSKSTEYTFTIQIQGSQTNVVLIKDGDREVYRAAAKRASNQSGRRARRFGRRWGC